MCISLHSYPIRTLHLNLLSSVPQTKPKKKFNQKIAYVHQFTLVSHQDAAPKPFLISTSNKAQKIKINLKITYVNQFTLISHQDASPKPSLISTSNKAGKKN
jgi:hypothetical protein